MGPLNTLSASRKSRSRCSRVRRRLAGSKLITGQEPLDEGSRRHGTAAGTPAAATRNPTPTLHLKVGIGAGGKPHPVAILGIGGLLGAGQGFRLLLASQEGNKEPGGVSGFTQGYCKAPGGSGGVAVVMEVNVALRVAGKAGEREDGAGCQGAGAAVIASTTGVSAAPPGPARSSRCRPPGSSGRT